MIRFSHATVAAASLMAFAYGPGANAQDALRIGAAGNTGGMIVFVAQDKGFFNKHGLDAKVEIRNTGPELTKSLNAGEIDLAPAAFTNLPAALERGLDLRGIVGYVGNAYSSTASDRQIGIVARADTGIKTIADLKGKKVAVSFGTSGDTYFQAALAKAGMSVGDVARSNLPPSSLVSALDTASVDAVVIWEPMFTTALDKVKGSYTVMRGGDFTCFCAMMHGSPAKVYADKKRTQAFVDAMSQAAFYLRDPKNLDEVAQIGSRFVRGMTPDLIKRTHQYADYETRIGPNTAKVFDAAVEQLIAQKKMKAPYDAMKYLDFEFINSTMKRHPEWFKDMPGAG
ncbi:MAG: ABC transporter substrate-binding protein [Proteobacteria bacterium]|nr:ABC transporter substrate-binding protein [Pseudomonadota bacterium]